MGQRFLEHFDKLIFRRADEIGAPVALLKIYLSRRLSVTLQRSVAQATKVRIVNLYTGLTGSTALDKSARSRVEVGQMQASVGSSY